MGIQCPSCRGLILPIKTIATGRAQLCSHCGAQLKRKFSPYFSLGMLTLYFLLKYLFVKFLTFSGWLAFLVALLIVLALDVLSSDIYVS